MPSEYLIDTIIPTKELHIIGGPSGVGKSTWLIQMLNDMDKGLPILGFKSKPTPWTYIACDRSKEGMQRILERMKLSIDESKFYSIEDIPGMECTLDPAETLIKWCPTPLIVIDAMFLMMAEGKGSNPMNDYLQMGKWIRRFVKLLRKYNKTAYGTAHSPKMKSGEGYMDKRQKVLGSVACAAVVETMFLLEREQEDKPEHMGRVLHLLPRNCAEQSFKYLLDSNGMYQPSTEEDEKDDAKDFLLSETFNSIPYGEFKTTPIVSLNYDKGISKNETYRWFIKLEAAGKITNGPKQGIKIKLQVT